LAGSQKRSRCEGLLFFPFMDHGLARPRCSAGGRSFSRVRRWRDRSPWRPFRREHKACRPMAAMGEGPRRSFAALRPQHLQGSRP
jgi:hypothetical protein